MKHSQRLARIVKNPKPHGYRKIVVDGHTFWWKVIGHGNGYTILDFDKKPVYEIYWNGEGTIRPKYVADDIKTHVLKNKSKLSDPNQFVSDSGWC